MTMTKSGGKNSDNLPAKNLTLDELRKYFHLPINQVAKELQVCVTVLKQKCRVYGIHRWPYRKVRKLDCIIEVLEKAAPSGDEEKDSELRAQLEDVKRKREMLLNDPNSKAHLDIGKLKTVKRKAGLLTDDEVEGDTQNKSQRTGKGKRSRRGYRRQRLATGVASGDEINGDSEEEDDEEVVDDGNHDKSPAAPTGPASAASSRRRTRTRTLAKSVDVSVMTSMNSEVHGVEADQDQTINAEQQLAPVRGGKKSAFKPIKEVVGDADRNNGVAEHVEPGNNSLPSHATNTDNAANGRSGEYSGQLDQFPRPLQAVAAAAAQAAFAQMQAAAYFPTMCWMGTPVPAQPLAAYPMEAKRDPCAENN